MTDKVTIRKEIKKKLSNLGGALRNDYSEIIRKSLVNSEEFINSEKIFIYISFDNEVHTTNIIKDALEKDKRVFVPNIKGNNMNMLEIDKNTVFTVNNYGIVEPSHNEIYSGDIDLVVMPLIGYDNTLARLGRGGGFYDKFLKDRDCTRIAIAYSLQEVDKLPEEPHDIKVNKIITEKGIIS